jgi:hypothetical protein
MRSMKLPLLAGALLLVGAGAASAQLPMPDCSFPERGTIDAQEWPAIQGHLDTLDGRNAFDTHPLVADRQSLVKKGFFGKQAGPMALIAARRTIENVDPETLAGGCFVGMIESAKADKDVGAFEGKTFIWVDRRGPDDTWRAIQYPLDGASKLDAEDEIAMPYALPEPTGEAEGRFAPEGRHAVYVGTLYRGSLEGMESLRGGRWMIRPPYPLTPVFGMGMLLGATDPALKLDTEVMGCVVCDRTTCCPQFLELVYMY